MIAKEDIELALMEARKYLEDKESNRRKATVTMLIKATHESSQFDNDERIALHRIISESSYSDFLGSPQFESEFLDLIGPTLASLPTSASTE